MNSAVPNVPAESARKLRPLQLAHIVFYTNDLAAMVRWYTCVLQADVTFSNERIAFLAFDDEHHRVAFVATEPYADRGEGKRVGFYHAAFSYASLGDLIATHERLLAVGIRPYRTIHHGPTVSLYYRDPDDNAIELQVDAFPDAETAKQWMLGEAFARNPIGVELDMNAYADAFHSGVPEAELLKRPDDR